MHYGCGKNNADVWVNLLISVKTVAYFAFNQGWLFLDQSRSEIVWVVYSVVKPNGRGASWRWGSPSQILGCAHVPNRDENECPTIGYWHLAQEGKHSCVYALQMTMNLSV